MKSTRTGKGLTPLAMEVDGVVVLPVNKAPYQELLQLWESLQLELYVKPAKHLQKLSESKKSREKSDLLQQFTAVQTFFQHRVLHCLDCLCACWSVVVVLTGSDLFRALLHMNTAHLTDCLTELINK